MTVLQRSPRPGPAARLQARFRRAGRRLAVVGPVAVAVLLVAGSALLAAQLDRAKGERVPILALS